MDPVIRWASRFFEVSVGDVLGLGLGFLAWWVFEFKASAGSPLAASASDFQDGFNEVVERGEPQALLPASWRIGPKID